MKGKAGNVFSSIQIILINKTGITGIKRITFREEDIR